MKTKLLLLLAFTIGFLNSDTVRTSDDCSPKAAF